MPGQYFLGRIARLLWVIMLPGQVMCFRLPARQDFFSGLSTLDFVKSNHIISYSKKALEKIREPLEKIAGIEGLSKHLESVKARFQ